MSAYDWERKLAGGPPVSKERLAANQRKVEARIRKMEQNKRKTIRWAAFGSALAVLLLVMGLVRQDLVREAWDWLGIDSKSKPVAAPVVEEGSRHLKLFVYDERMVPTIQQNYVRLMMLKHPEWDIEVVGGKFDFNDPVQSLKKAIEETKPDVIYTQATYYDALVELGALSPIDDMIKRDRYDIEGIHAGALEPLRKNGQLYALPVTMESAILFYNKDLFDRYRIPYPKSGLSWSELFELARRFPAAAGKTGDVYGFHPDSSGFGFVMELAQAYGINPITKDGTRVDVHSGSWRSIWTAVLDGYRGGVFSSPPDMGGGSYMVADWVKKHPFMLGQSAMALGRSNYTSNLLSYLNNFEQYGLQPFKWEAIPAPTDPSAPGASRMYAPLELFAVSAASSEKEEAWKLVAAVSSNETVQYRMKTQELRGSSPLSVLPARSEPAIKAGSEQLKPFYELAAVKREDGVKIDYLNPAYREFSTIAGEEYKQAEAGQETLNEMIGRIEQRMQPKLANAGEAVAP